MTRTERRRGAATVKSWVALGCLALMACSGAAAPGGEEAARPAATAAAAPDPAGTQLRPTGAPAPAPKRDTAQATSRILGKQDRTIAGGARVCAIDFVYAGREPEDLFWEEPCAAVTAKMMTRAELTALRRWDRLDEFQRKFVEAMPGGLVLYVEGAASASVYPIDTTGTSIEVPVAD